ncbi:MAG TPA: SufD family Fe-S cluster assembly protein, partial [Steroidobacteraceae bacterium]|nr:SufD family Fe-S cluster assembly protein [Steroidobacteraceae bacterium]
MATPFAERLAREQQVAAAAAPAYADAARRQALDALAGLGLPTSRDENWKYANLRALERVRFAPRTQTFDAAVAAALPPRVEGASRQVFVDGLHSAQLSDPLREDAALSFRSLRSAGQSAGGAAPTDAAQHRDARFALLNAAFAVDGAQIAVERGDGAPSRLELVFVAVAEGTEAASYPRIRVSLEPDARLELVERHVGAGDAASFSNAAVDITVAERAQLSHYRLQEAGPRALWIDTLSAEVARDARYELHSIAFGAASARSTSLIRLAAEGAHASVHAAAVADRQQVLDAFVRIEHAAPRTTTDEVFRGIAGGRSRVAFNGMVVVQPGARGADSRQSLRGLLAGPEAEIDARPQLEIYTDDVRCSHGATAGTLDETMLFYLLSRGIDRQTARSLLEWAFLED